MAAGLGCCTSALVFRFKIGICKLCSFLYICEGVPYIVPAGKFCQIRFPFIYSQSRRFSIDAANPLCA